MITKRRNTPFPEVGNMQRGYKFIINSQRLLPHGRYESLGVLNGVLKLHMIMNDGQTVK
jgi:hypothetical protein